LNNNLTQYLAATDNIRRIIEPWMNNNMGSYVKISDSKKEEAKKRRNWIDEAVQVIDYILNQVFASTNVTQPMIEEWCATAVMNLKENRRDSLAKLMVQRLCSIINFERKTKETPKNLLSYANTETNDGAHEIDENHANVQTNTGLNNLTKKDVIVQPPALPLSKGKMILPPPTLTLSATSKVVVWLLIHSVQEESFMWPSNKLPGYGPKGLLCALVTWVTNVQAKGKQK
jgi:hypothetical protein